jgi:hypothetical protein
MMKRPESVSVSIRHILTHLQYLGIIVRAACTVVPKIKLLFLKVKLFAIIAVAGGGASAGLWIVLTQIVLAALQPSLS